MDSKDDLLQKERDKLREIFRDVDPCKVQLVEGLIEDAAFLMMENRQLRNLIAATGSVKVHPQHPELQKATPAASQYLKNVNSYAVIIKTLNSILQKNTIEPDDDFEEFMKARSG